MFNDIFFNAYAGADHNLDLNLGIAPSVLADDQGGNTCQMVNYVVQCASNGLPGYTGAMVISSRWFPFRFFRFIYLWDVWQRKIGYLLSYTSFCRTFLQPQWEVNCFTAINCWLIALCSGMEWTPVSFPHWRYILWQTYLNHFDLLSSCNCSIHCRVEVLVTWCLFWFDMKLKIYTVPSLTR